MTTMRVSMIVGLACTTGCFAGQFLEGTPCQTDADCGPSLTCEDGVCGGRPGGEQTTTGAGDGGETSSGSASGGDEGTTEASDDGGTTSTGGLGDTGSSTTSDASSVTGDGSESSTTGGQQCQVTALPSTVPVISPRISTMTGTDYLWSSKCGGEQGWEQAFSWTAPVDGMFAMHAIVHDGSFSPILYVLDGEGCDGPELECDRATYGDIRAATTLDLTAGESITLVVDGDSQTAIGEVEVEIRDATACIDGSSAGDVRVTVQQSTIGASDDSHPGGAGFGSPDYAFTWVAPRAGRYMIDTAGTTFDSILSVQKGGCFGKELAFADGLEWGGEFVAVDLVQDDEILVLVDGYAPAPPIYGDRGPFTVHINDSESCAEATVITGPDTVTGDTSLATNDFGGLVVSESGSALDCVYGKQAPDVAYFFDPALEGHYEFDVSMSSFPAVIATYRAGCILPDSPLTYCAHPAFQGQPENQMASALLSAGERLLVVLDGESAGDEGPYQLDVRRVGGCFDKDVGNGEFVSEPASTVGRTNRATPLCNTPNASADYIARWRSPSAGRWRFSTSNASFDTAIGVFRGQCSIDQIACDRGSLGDGNSQVIVELAADEEVTVSVDAVQWSVTGTFTLNIAPAS